MSSKKPIIVLRNGGNQIYHRSPTSNGVTSNRGLTTKEVKGDNEEKEEKEEEDDDEKAQYSNTEREKRNDAMVVAKPSFSDDDEELFWDNVLKSPLVKSSTLTDHQIDGDRFVMINGRKFLIPFGKDKHSIMEIKKKIVNIVGHHFENELILHMNDLQKSEWMNMLKELKDHHMKIAYQLVLMDDYNNVIADLMDDEERLQKEDEMMEYPNNFRIKRLLGPKNMSFYSKLPMQQLAMLHHKYNSMSHLFDDSKKLSNQTRNNHHFYNKIEKDLLSHSNLKLHDENDYSVHPNEWEDWKEYHIDSRWGDIKRNFQKKISKVTQSVDNKIQKVAAKSKSKADKAGKTLDYIKKRRNVDMDYKNSIKDLKEEKKGEKSKEEKGKEPPSSIGSQISSSSPFVNIDVEVVKKPVKDTTDKSSSSSPSSSSSSSLSSSSSPPSSLSSSSSSTKIQSRSCIHINDLIKEKFPELYYEQETNEIDQSPHNLVPIIVKNNINTKIEENSNNVFSNKTLQTKELTTPNNRNFIGCHYETQNRDYIQKSDKVKKELWLKKEKPTFLQEGNQNSKYAIKKSSKDNEDSSDNNGNEDEEDTDEDEDEDEESSSEESDSDAESSSEEEKNNMKKNKKDGGNKPIHEDMEHTFGIKSQIGGKMKNADTLGNNFNVEGKVSFCDDGDYDERTITYPDVSIKWSRYEDNMTYKQNAIWVTPKGNSNLNSLKTVNLIDKDGNDTRRVLVVDENHNRFSYKVIDKNGSNSSMQRNYNNVRFKKNENLLEFYN